MSDLPIITPATGVEHADGDPVPETSLEDQVAELQATVAALLAVIAGD